MDAIDRHIVQLLRSNGRISNAQLAAEVGLSPSACHRRVRQLEASGVIRGYQAIVADPAQQDGVTVFVHVTLERQSSKQFKTFEAAVRQCLEVQECYLMTGEADYIIRIKVDSLKEYEALYTETLAKLPFVARIQSSVSMRDVLLAH